MCDANHTLRGGVEACAVVDELYKLVLLVDLVVIYSYFNKEKK